ncbi:MAG: hypothetical protein K2N01_11775 [Lachnospiraceae bacterium]|nr:hypothetical protein [Lachnospiraceae bacterium]
MLGKVMKHEFLDTGRVMIPLNLGAIGVLILGIMIECLNFPGDMLVILKVATILLYVFALMVLSVISYIYLAVRFYKSMFGSESYLTHTLPVGSFAKLNGKLLVALIWMLVNSAVCALSVIALIAVALKQADVTVPWGEVEQMLDMMFQMSPAALVAWCVLIFIVSSLQSLLMIYVSMSVGQLFQKHKIGASVLTYVIIYVVLQVISATVSATKSIALFEVSDSMDMIDPGFTMGYLMGDFYKDLLGMSLIMSAVCAVVFYGVTAYICNRKINLD